MDRDLGRVLAHGLQDDLQREGVIMDRDLGRVLAHGLQDDMQRKGKGSELSVGILCVCCVV